MRPLPLIGPSYNLESRPASVQRTVNLMPVPLEPGNERTGWVFRDVPGLTLFETTDLQTVVAIFDLTEEDEEFVVPAGVTTIAVLMWAGGGAGALVIEYPTADAYPGGAAAYLHGDISVTPLETLVIRVGGGGNGIDGSGFGGFGGGGGGGTNDAGGALVAAGGGGGASAIFRGLTPFLIAGAGGGGSNHHEGGAGGGAIGGDGEGGGYGGKGGTQLEGGEGGSSAGGAGSAIDGAPGAFMEGGDGAVIDFGAGLDLDPQGGGGGSGYYGGGGGALATGMGGTTGGGGGGSSLVVDGVVAQAGSGQTPAGSDSEYWDGHGVGGNAAANGGNGRVVLIYTQS